MKQKRVVIVGAGIGGLTTALSLARRDKQIDIVLVDKAETHVYTPWLYDVAVSALGTRKKQACVKQVAEFSIPALFEKQHFPHLRFRQGSLVAVHQATKSIELADGHTLQYDMLVLALGSAPCDFGIDGVKKYGHFLKYAQDAYAIQEDLQRRLTRMRQDGDAHEHIVFVGAGATGVEVATELAHNIVRMDDMYSTDVRDRCHIDIMYTSAYPLSQLSTFSQRYAADRLQALGIRTIDSARVHRVDAEQVYAHTEQGDRSIPYSYLVWVAGIEPNPILKNIDVHKTQRGRLQVDETLQTSDNAIFAIGDNAAFTDKQGRVLPPTAWAALDQGIHMAKNLQRILHGKAARPFSSPKHWPSIVTVGSGLAVVEVAGMKIRGKIGFIIRHIVDLQYFIRVFGLRHGWAIWRKGRAFLSM